MVKKENTSYAKKAFQKRSDEDSLERKVLLFNEKVKGIDVETVSPEMLLLLNEATSIANKAVEFEAEAQKYKVASITDGLTGLKNREYFDSELEKALARSARNGSIVALALVDIDHFKKFNDNHGHLVGDAVLKGVAGRFQGMIRDNDTAARYGGEELAAIIEIQPSDDLEKPLKRLEEHMCSLEVSHKGTTYKVGNSIGVAIIALPTEEKNPETYAEILIEYADKMLYKAKAGGRGKMEVLECEFEEIEITPPSPNPELS